MLTSETNPGAESVGMTAGGPSNGLIPTQRVSLTAFVFDKARDGVRRYTFADYQD